MTSERSIDRVPRALRALPHIAVFDKASLSCRGVEDGVSVLVDFVEGMHRVVFEVDNPEHCDDLASKAVAPILRECGDAAFAALFELRGWSGLHRWFRDFPTADHGSTAEMLSVLITGRLVDEWGTLRRLEHETRKDSGFESVVLSHIHATGDDGDLSVILENAKANCPAQLPQLCASIAIAAQKALDEAKAVNPAAFNGP